MKNNYIAPSICIEEMIEDGEILSLSTNERSAIKTEEVMSKERNTVDFSSDSDWDF